MSRQRISRLQRQRVAAAAGYCCAYCHVSERIIGAFMEIVCIRRTGSSGGGNEPAASCGQKAEQP